MTDTKKKPAAPPLQPWQRRTIGAGILVAALVLLAVSITCNVTFARTFGTSSLERNTLGAMAVASDVIKGTAAMIVIWLVHRRLFVPAAFAGTLGAIALVFSVAASIGFLATERVRAYDEAKRQVDMTVEAKADIADLKKRAQWVPDHRPLAVLKAEQDARQQDSRFKATDGCRDVRGDRLEIWCRSYREIAVQIASAEEAARLEESVTARREYVAKEGRSVGDAQIAVMAGALGVDEKTMLILLVGLGVLLIELGSTMGLTVAMAMLIGDRGELGQALRVVFSRQPVEPDPRPPATAAPPVQTEPPPARIASTLPAARPGGLRQKIVAAG